MRISFSKIEPTSGHKMTHLRPDDFESLDGCPVCSSQAAERIVRIEGVDGSVANEVSFCDRCEHTYLSRRPSPEWYQGYYSDEWDNSSGETRKRVGFKERLKTMLRAVKNYNGRNLIHYYDSRSQSADVKAMKIIPMLTGVATNDNYGLVPDPKVRSVLDVGCGLGDALILFQRLGLRTTGVEASRYRARFCRERGLDVHHCELDDFSKIRSLPDAPFDLVYSAHVFEHILSPTKHLREIAVVLRDGGYLYIEVPNVTEGEGLFKFSHSVTHCHAFSLASAIRMVSLAGFNVVRVKCGYTLHILAVKESKRQFDVRGTATRASLTRGLESVAVGSAADVQVAFDHKQMRIQEFGTSRILFEDSVHLCREPSTMRGWPATIEAAEPHIAIQWPLIAPVWVKQQ
jgi:SAM-dependent methyltransferase